MERDVYCLYCGYRLNGLGIKGDCPECGEEFDKGIRNGVSFENVERINSTTKGRYLGVVFLGLAFVIAVLALIGQQAMGIQGLVGWGDACDGSLC